MTAKDPLNISIAQLNPVLGDISGNFEKICRAWEQEEGKSDLVVFSEMIICGYPPEDLVLKPAFIEEIKIRVNNLAEISKNKKSAILISAPWQIDDKRYNAALLIYDGKIKDIILKHHLPNYGVFDEYRIFKSAPLPLPVKFKNHVLGIMTCEDMWYSDVTKKLKNEGAEILIVLNGSPFSHHKNSTRLLQARNRSLESGLALIYVNQIGGQDELVFDGSSFVLNNKGEITKDLPAFKEAVESLPPDIYSKAGKNISRLSESNLPEANIGTVYEALMLGLRDYVEKNGFPGVIIGLSGGIDSAISAIIAVDALGSEKVHCVMMPSRYTSRESLNDASELAGSLNVKLDTISIEKPFSILGDVLSPYFDENTPGTTYENIQPRIRGLILMALSNAGGNMVLSTGNKSEMAVGYATLYGDMCGGFNVLKDIYKTEVYNLSRWRNNNRPRQSKAPKDAYIPENIIIKEPSAELKDNQKDQDSLPPYDELDHILKCLIEHDMSIEKIVKSGNHKRDTVIKVWRMLDRSEYKRRQAAPGIKITSRAFGRDRRYPITNHFLNIVEKC